MHPDLNNLLEPTRNRDTNTSNPSYFFHRGVPKIITTGPLNVEPSVITLTSIEMITSRTKIEAKSPKHYKDYSVTAKE